MAFVARPRSKAAGAEPRSALIFDSIGSAIDLHALCGLDSDRPDHSGQFNRRIQELGPFYDRMIIDLEP